MDIKKISLVKKNFYLAIFVVVLLFAIGFVIAAYDASKASHETLYTNRIEPKTGPDIVLSPLGNIGIGVDTPSAKLDVAGDIRSNGKLVCLVNGTNCPVSAQGKWDGTKPGNIYYNDGNVGIGISSPTQKLDVNGNIKASGTVCDINGCIGKEWQIVSQENFDSGAVGWNPSTTYTCGANIILGRYGNERDCIDKTFNSLPAHSRVKINAIYWYGDSWDNEYSFLRVDGETVWKNDWNSNFGARFIESNICGGSQVESTEVVNLETYHSGSSIKIEFCSTLDQGASDEWFGVDNFYLEVW